MLDFLFKESEIFKNGFITVIILIVVSYIICKIINKMVHKLIVKTIEKKGDKYTGLYFVEKVIRVILLLIALVIIISEVKPLSTLSKTMLGASSIIAAIAGLAAQESLGNVVSGFFLALFQPFVVNNLITIKDKNITGTVVEIGLRHTVVKTYENTRIVIPNSIMNTAIIENKDNSADETYNNFLYLNISYDADIEKVKEIIIKQCSEHKAVLDVRSAKEKKEGVPIVKVLVTNFLDYSIELRVTIVTKDVASGFVCLSDLRQSIKKAFDENGINIPFPTTTIINDQ